MRLGAAVQGAVVGLVVALGLAVSVLGLARTGLTTTPSPALLLGIGLAVVTLAALGAALRSISLQRCARAMDMAVGARGGESRNGDRSLSAVALIESGAGGGSPVAAAAVRDALRAAHVVPVRMAAPVRRPRGRAIGGGLALMVLVLALAPVKRAPAAATTSVTSFPGGPRTRLAAA